MAVIELSVVRSITVAHPWRASTADAIGYLSAPEMKETDCNSYGGVQNYPGSKPHVIQGQDMLYTRTRAASLMCSLVVFGCGDSEPASPDSDLNENNVQTNNENNVRTNNENNANNSNAPVANMDQVRTNQGEPVFLFPLENDTHPLNDSLFLESVASPENGTASFADDQVSYEPSPEFFGVELFEYTVGDSAGKFDIGTIQINVNATPLAVDDSFSIVPGEMATLQVLTNDSDPDSETISITDVTNPTQGEVMIVGDALSYASPESFDGSDEFTYTIDDEFGASATATVRVFSNGPRASDDSVLVVTGEPNAIDVLANDTDPDDDPLMVVSATDPALGTTTIENNQVVYEAPFGTTGPDMFEYTVSDGQSEQTATVTLELNNPPTARPDIKYVVVDTSTDLNLSLNDSDFDGDSFQVTDVGNPTSGTATLNGGTVTYVPTSGFEGTDSFTYTITDARGASASSTATIEVVEGGVVTSLSADRSRTCVTRANGELDCWGNGMTRGLVGAGMNWIDVDVQQTSCAIRDDHTLWCWDWGMDNLSQVGTDADWRTIEKERTYTCGIKLDGSLWCWGRGTNFVLGNGSEQDLAVPTQVGTGTDWIEIELTQNRVMAIRGTGELWGWGNGPGGGGGGQPGSTQSPTQYGMDVDWSSPTFAGPSFSPGCMIKGGSIHCWGGAGSRVLEFGPYPNSEFSGGWSSAVIGGDTMCAINSSDELFCWGNNAFGMIGDGSLDDSSWPVRVGSDSNWADVDIGGNYVCAFQKRSTDVYCWGRNDAGQLGGEPALTTTPNQVGVSNNWRSVHAGVDHTCALRQDGTRWCWGDNRNGQLGDSTTESKLAPVQADSRVDWDYLALGRWHGCGALNDGSIWCWGTQGTRQPTVTTPRSILSAGTSLRSGGYESCAVSASGTYECWGLSSVHSGWTISPYTRDANTDWQQVTAGASNCGLRGGQLWCVPSNGSTLVSGGSDTDWAEITTNPNSMCGLKTDNSLWCGTITGTKTELAPGKVWSSLTQKWSHKCAIDSSQKLFCWGGNSFGQLGTGMTSFIISTPTQVGSQDWSQVSTGRHHTCAVRSDDTLWCWGSDGYGQSGAGQGWATTPTAIP